MRNGIYSGMAAAVVLPPSSLLTGLTNAWALSDLLDPVGSLTLTNVGTTTFTAGKNGNAATLARASGQKLTRASAAAIAKANVDYTFSLWFKATTLTNGHVMALFAKGDLDSNIEYGAYLDCTGTPCVSFKTTDGDSASIVSSPVALTTGTYFHVRCGHKVNAGSPKNFISVNNETEVLADGSYYQSGAEVFCVGGDTGTTNYMNGQIDELYLWSKLLTAPEPTTLQTKYYPTFA